MYDTFYHKLPSAKISWSVATTSFITFLILLLQDHESVSVVRMEAHTNHLFGRIALQLQTVQTVGRGVLSESMASLLRAAAYLLQRL